ncbi:hypothetical protein HBH70_062770 [Parastagonospora nodorum]|nr:hypothetical protein HBH49_059850 [Parastagonospora nodorum]KAH4102055.1 hypothetical protein HBH46_131340 [Parastagonospora nodorum]KAH4130077.1 hypothetical protein HBH47_025060 [Parastagonospora nodorum]KAH4165026.1 hypothetical protein HBH43_139480 [Parastagonospora nodorum]KAH4202439.1 hypothetical protein HBH42_018330 [Parastagonospora nodorum]
MRELKHEEIANFPKDATVGDIVVTLLAKLQHCPTATADFFDPKVTSIRIIGNLYNGNGEKHEDFLIWRKGNHVHCGFFAFAKDKGNDEITAEWKWFTRSSLEPVSREGEWKMISAFRTTISDTPLGSMWTEDTTMLGPGNTEGNPIDSNEILYVSSQFAENLLGGEAWEPKNHREYLVHVLRNPGTPGQPPGDKYHWEHSSVKPPSLYTYHENDFPKSENK